MGVPEGGPLIKVGAKFEDGGAAKLWESDGGCPGAGTMRGWLLGGGPCG